MPRIGRATRARRLRVEPAFIVALLSNLLAAAPAPAQHLPSELWNGFELVAVESTAAFSISGIDADLRIKEARARFQLGDLERVRKELSDASGWPRHEELLRAAGSDLREAALIRALAAFLAERDGECYDLANEVHRGRSLRKPDVPDREANVLKAITLARAGVLASAFSLLQAELNEPNAIPLSKALAAELSAGDGFAREPIRRERSHRRAADVRVVVDGVLDADRSDGQLWNVTFISETDLFIGALVVEAYREPRSGARRYRLGYYDLDAPPLLLRDYGERRPSLDEIEQIGDSFTPRISLLRDSDEKYTPLRAEVEALYWMREGVTPLAAWWAERSPDAAQVRESVVEPLTSRQCRNWRKHQRFDVGLRKPLQVVGFSNADLSDPAAFATSRDPCEHYHFIAASGGERFRADYVLISKFVELPDEPAGGVRLYFLHQHTPRGVREIEAPLVGEPPAYDDVAALVRKRLEELERVANGGESLPPPIVRTELPPRGPLSWTETTLMVAGMAVGLLAFTAILALGLALVRKARRLGTIGTLMIGALLGLAAAAAIFWATAQRSVY